MFRNFARTINDFANNSKGIQAVEVPESEKQQGRLVIVALGIVSIIIFLIFINK